MPSNIWQKTVSFQFETNCFSLTLRGRAYQGLKNCNLLFTVVKYTVKFTMWWSGYRQINEQFCLPWTFNLHLNLNGWNQVNVKFYGIYATKWWKIKCLEYIKIITLFFILWPYTVLKNWLALVFFRDMIYYFSSSQARLTVGINIWWK